MKSDPDFVEAFVPNGTNETMVYDSNGNKIAEYAVVFTKADKYSAGNKYLCFIGGDQPLEVIHNPNKKDGSSIVVVKESYGNAFVPFMIDYFEQIVVVDIREETKGTGALIEQYGVTDVIFINNCQAAISFEEIIRNKALS
jgi:hypothetical protein